MLKDTKLINYQAFLKEYIGLNIDLWNTNTTNVPTFLHNLRMDEKKFKDLTKVLENDNLTLVQKQQMIFDISAKDPKKIYTCDFKVPSIFGGTIKKLDDYVFSEKFSDDPTEALKYVSLMKVFLNEDILEKNYKTKNSKRHSEVFKKCINKFKEHEISFGLFLLFHVGDILTSYLKHHDKRRVTVTSKKHIIKMSGALSEYAIDRTRLSHMLGKNLAETFELLNQGEPLQMNSDLLETEKTYESILEKPVLENITEKDVVSMGTICLAFLYYMDIFDITDENTIITKTKNEFSTTVHVTLNDKHLSDFSTVLQKKAQYPQLLAPNDYTFEKREGNSLNFPNDGQLIANNTDKDFQLKLNGFIRTYKETLVYLQDDEVQSLNFLRNNYYSVNVPLLNHIKNDSLTYFIKFLNMKDPNIVEDILKKSTCNNYLELKDFDTFFHETIEYKLLRSRKPRFNGNKAETLRYNLQYNTIHDSLRTQYQSALKSVYEYIDIITKSYLFRDQKFYFNCVCDSRGRVYYDGSGYFGLQKNNLSKALINLQGNSIIKKEVGKPDMNNEFHKIKFSELMKDGEDSYFEALSYNINGDVNTISCDATCSGMSIIGGILGHEQILLQTQVIKRKKTNKLSKNEPDVYYVFLDEFSKTWDDDFIKFCKIKTKLNKMSTESGIDSEVIASKFNLLASLIKSEVLTRKCVKKIVMKILFSQTNLGRQKELKSEIIDRALIGQDLIFFDDYITDNFSYFLAVKLEEIFQRTFPEVSELMKMLQQLDFKHLVILSAPNSGEVAYREFRTTKKRLTLPKRPYENKQPRITFLEKTDKVNTEKMRRSITANWTHYLDAKLALGVLKECLRREILIFTNHDCFYTPETCVIEVKKIYFEVFEKLILNENILDDLFKRNNINPSKKDILTEYLKKVRENKGKFNKKFKKSYIFNEKVLS